jgi:hypothetical protein
LADESKTGAVVTLKLKLPPTLRQLMENGVWPSDLDTQNKISYSIKAERVKRIPSDESEIYLFAPPFITVANCGSDHGFW